LLFFDIFDWAGVGAGAWAEVEFDWAGVGAGAWAEVEFDWAGVGVEAGAAGGRVLVI